MPGKKARARAKPRPPTATARRSRCARAKSKPSSTTATRASRSPSISASRKATRAPPISRRARSGTRWRRRSPSRASPRRTSAPDFPTRRSWRASRRSSTSFIPGSCRSSAPSRSQNLARLASRKIQTVQAPVLFEAPAANGLLSSFVSAVSGGSLYRKASFLLDSLGKEVFSPIVNLVERPHLARGPARSWFDDEGVATRDRDVVKDGVLRGYFLGSYSARKLGMRTTGSAGGNQNLILEGGQLDLPGLIRKMDRGLLVTELMGHGINPVTGDYSRGAAGYWVERGEIRHPVEEITIAGNLRDMFRSIAAIGRDALTRGSRTCGSILVEEMTIAGN